MKRCAVVIAFLSVAGCGALFAQHNNFQAYSIEEGLPQSNVYSILQDSQGYLWVGTDGGGLSRFDGTTFKTYNKKTGLTGNVVRALMEDSKGHIWIGTDEGISVFDGLTFRSITKDDSLKGSTVLAFCEDQNGVIWAATDDQGINKIKIKGDQVDIENINKQMGLTSPSVFDIYSDKYGRLWLATLYGGINVITFIEDTFEIHTLRGGSDIPSELILKIEEDNDGNLWCGTYDAGAFKIVHNDDQTWSVMTYDNLSQGSVWSILPCRNGEIWFGTGEDGCKRLYPSTDNKGNNRFAQYTMLEGLPNNQILSLCEDTEGNIWLGTNGDGLCKFAGDNFAHYGAKEGFSSDKIMGIDQDIEGTYWLVTDGGGVIKLSFTNGKPHVENITTEDGLTSDYLTAIAIGKATNDYVWIATTKNGIIKYDGKNFENFNELDGLKNNRVHSIMVDTKGIVWCGTANGISRYDGVKFLNRSMEVMMVSDDGVKAIIEGKDGTLWFGTAGALVRYAGAESMTTYDEEEGLYDKDINALAEDARGNIWIGTNGGGIYMFDMLTDDSIPISQVINDERLSSSAINSLMFLNNNTLIVGTDKGFDKLTLNDEREVVKVRNYDASDGFIGVECNDNALFKDMAGNLWFGTGKGITRYDPGLENPNENPPVTHITELRLFFKPVDWTTWADTIAPWFNLPKSLELPYSENHLTFYFSGISLQNPRKVLYQYMLEGQDVDWSPPASEVKVTYSGLSPGEYTFKVKAKNAKGIWNEQPTTFHFVIRPPWYQTLWFYITCVVVLILGFYLFVKIRERKLKREKMILENKVVQRTAEVVRQKEEIEEKSKEITDSINYAKKIQQAILPLSEQIKKVLPESFVLFKPKDIVSGDFYWVTQKDNKVLFTVADCTGHGVPGAFMSMIGSSLLNEVVNKNGVTIPSDILFEVRKGIINSLKQTGEHGQQKDGMDMALCAFEKKSSKLEYSGANNPLFVVRKIGEPLLTDTGEPIDVNMSEGDYSLFEIKANKQPVGYYTGEQTPFDNHTVMVQKGDSVYSFSDGFPDQFGGPNGKKFKSKMFKKLLLSIQDKSMHAQEELLDKTIEDWRGDLDQIDDICVIGVRV